MSDRLKNMQTNKLVDVVKNCTIYGYDASIRDKAIELLKERGVQTEDLVYFGKNKGHEIKHAESILKVFNRSAFLALLCYTAFLLQLLIQPTEENLILLTFGRISTLILYVIFLIGGTFSIVRFNKVVKKTENSGDVIMFILFGMPFFLIVYLHFIRKMREDLARMNP